MEAVIGRRAHGLHACLPGYVARRVRRAEYPGLVRCPTEKACGRLYRDITAGELDVLDRFEGCLYRRRRQPVVLYGGRRVQAWTYMVAKGREKKVSGKPWHLNRFMRTDYARFMQRFVEDRRAQYRPR